jgi:hypothetical protein
MASKPARNSSINNNPKFIHKKKLIFGQFRRLSPDIEIPQAVLKHNSLTNASHEITLSPHDTNRVSTKYEA